MKRHVSKSEIFAKSENRKELKRLSEQLQRVGLREKAFLDWSFKQKKSLGILKHQIEASTGNIGNQQSCTDMHKDDSQFHDDYFSRWVLFVNDFSPSRHQQEQVQLSQMRRDRLWRRWQAKRTTPRTPTSTPGHSQIHFDSVSATSKTNRREREIKVFKGKSDATNVNRFCSSAHCIGKRIDFASGGKFKHDASERQKDSLILNAERCKSARPINTYRATKPSVTKFAFKDNEYERLEVDSQTARVSCERKQRKSERSSDFDDDWDDYGISTLFGESDSNLDNGPHANTPNNLPNNSFLRVRPFTVIGGAPSTSGLWCHARISDIGISRSNLVGTSVTHRGCKIRWYVSPMERYKLSKDSASYHGDFSQKLPNYLLLRPRSAAPPSPVFPKPVRQRALTRLVSASAVLKKQSTEDRRVENRLDAKVKDFVHRIETFCRSQERNQKHSISN